MWYWNQQNFEGLVDVADSIADQCQWRLFGDYCRLREKGLRKPALDAIMQFIAHTNAWSDTERQQFADWIYATQLRFPDVHQLIVTPLNHDLLIPTLQHWAATDSHNPAPRRWLGFATGNNDHFTAALTLDSRDDISRFRLVCGGLSDVDHQCHHLPDFFIGDPRDAIVVLNRAKKLATDFTDPCIAPTFGDELANLFDKVNDWMAYQATDRDISFLEWCKNHERTYAWGHSYYYTR